MAEREKQIISEARITLNDTEKLRWSDKRLFQLLSNAQQEMCRDVPLIVRQATINTHPGQTEYRLPPDAIKLLTVRTDTRVLDVVSMEELDRVAPSWEDDIGVTYQAIVMNNLSQSTIRPYPKLPDTYDESVPLKIRYSVKPQELGYKEDSEGNGDTEIELSISNMWDTALIQYVISKAFIDYGDTTSLSRAQVADGLYMKELGRAFKLAKKAYSKKIVTTGFSNKVARTRFTQRNTYGSSCYRY
jgi:hypothetical protein